MSDIEDILAQLREGAEHPWRAVEQAKAEGRAVAGCVPYFFPLELVHAAGMHPIELWGGGSSTGAAGSYYPAFYCSLLFTLMERVLDGSYDDLDCVIVPTTWDGLRNLEENWKFARPDAAIIDVVQPTVRTTPEAHAYMVQQLHRVAERLETITGSRITERAMRTSIALYNRQRAALRRFSALAARHADSIAPCMRQAVFAAARSMAVERHTALVEQLDDALAALSVHEFPGIKVVLTGVLVDSPSLLVELEKNGIAVVGDLTISESARYSHDVPGRVDPFDSLAALWERVRGVSVALDPLKERGELLAALVRERGADGVVMCSVKFCEAEEFDAPVMKQQLEAQNIALLVLEMESQEVASEQAATRIQAFAEMLGDRSGTGFCAADSREGCARTHENG